MARDRCVAVAKLAMIVVAGEGGGGGGGRTPTIYKQWCKCCEYLPCTCGLREISYSYLLRHNSIDATLTMAKSSMPQFIHDS